MVAALLACQIQQAPPADADNLELAVPAPGLFLPAYPAVIPPVAVQLLIVCVCVFAVKHVCT
jgi:hypothetical protein